MGCIANRIPASVKQKKQNTMNASHGLQKHNIQQSALNATVRVSNSEYVVYSLLRYRYTDTTFAAGQPGQP
jgi:hypothetical protein